MHPESVPPTTDFPGVFVVLIIEWTNTPASIPDEDEDEENDCSRIKSKIPELQSGILLFINLYPFHLPV